MERKAINKEGRHVGLDFYDLLIEGHYTQVPYRKATMSVIACYANHQRDAMYKLPESELRKQFAWMRAQRACQLEDIQQRKIAFASFDIG
jgi:hypothetical protein